MNYFRLLWNLHQQKQNTKKSRQQIELLQKRKLERMLRYAYEHSPYYRRTFEAVGINSETIATTPLSMFPTLDKEQLMEHFDDLVTDRSLNQKELLYFDEHSEDGEEIYRGKYHVVHSSGSTGIPRYYVYDNAAWEHMLVGIIRGALWGMSMTEILKLLAEKPRILYIAATDGRYGGAMAVGDGIRGVRAEQRFLDINTPLSEWIETIEKFRPNIIIGYPSAVKILVELMEAEDTELNVRRIISCGEPLPPGLRRYLEDTFETEVMNFYGASESLALGVEAQAEEGMFLFDDLNIVEVIDGEMYLTCLYNFTQPLIRYHISDHLILRESEQGTSCSFTKADVLLCRNEDVLWFETGGGRMEYLHPLSIEGFCVEGLMDDQVCRTSKNSFEMIAEIASPSDAEKVSSEITQQMRILLEKNGLADVQFSIRFTTQIMPDINTGKKLLIVGQEEQDMTTKKEYRQEYLTGERALFQGKNLRIIDTIFDDGESPLKESHDIELLGCMFKWKYPLWYAKNIIAKNCTWFEMGRAGVWYTKQITVEDSAIEAPKNFRRCEDVTLRNVSFPNAAETLWHCDGVSMERITAKGDYFAMNSQNMKISDLTLYGNYSFDGARNVEIHNSRLLSKDAFWNSENVTVYDSFISGEYLGWNAKNLTLINCTIESLQGMCYIDNLVMKNCKLLNTTLAFEYSTVDADIVGEIDSVMNPSGGVIRADSIAELIIEKDKVNPDKTKIICRQDEAKPKCICA